MSFAKHHHNQPPPVPTHEFHKPTPGTFVPPDQRNITRIIIRAPIGGKFSFWGNDMYLEIQKGKELEAVEHLRNWIETYVVYIAKYYIDLEAQIQAEKAGLSAKPKEEESNDGIEKE